MTEDELYRAIHSDIKGLKVAVQRVADQVALCNNRVQVVENRMDRTDSGARRLTEEAKAVDEKLDRIEASLNGVSTTIASWKGAQQAIAVLVGLAVPILGGLMWLIQHGGSK
jgi:phage-related protein